MAVSNDFDWIELDESVIFLKNEIYHIKDGNNWTDYKFIDYIPEYKPSFGDGTYPVYCFECLEYCSYSYKSVSYVEELCSKNLIRYYNPNFNYYNELNVKKVELDSNSIPLIQPNFVIIFRNGVDVKDTQLLQNLLFGMGYTWINKGDNLIGSEEVKHKILTLESLNWDTSNYLYSGMDSTFGDNKILMLSTLEGIECERDKERRLNFIHNHPQIHVIDGDDLLSKI